MHLCIESRTGKRLKLSRENYECISAGVYKRMLEGGREHTSYDCKKGKWSTTFKSRRTLKMGRLMVPDNPPKDLSAYNTKRGRKQQNKVRDQQAHRSWRDIMNSADWLVWNKLNITKFYPNRLRGFMWRLRHRTLFPFYGNQECAWCGSEHIDIAMYSRNAILRIRHGFRYNADIKLRST